MFLCHSGETSSSSTLRILDKSQVHSTMVIKRLKETMKIMRGWSPMMVEGSCGVGQLPGERDEGGKG